MASILRRFIIVPGVLLLIVAGVFAGLPIRNELAKNRQVSNANSVEATVLSTNMTQRVDSERGGETKVYWSVRVQYRYTVNGTTYESDAVTPPGTSDGGTNLHANNKSVAKKFRSDHQENTTITAYYPSSEPSEAFLKKETTPLIALAIPAGFGLLIGMVGTLLIAFGAGLLTFSRR